MQHGLADNQFADKIHYRFDARGIHTKSVLGYGSDGGSARGLLPASSVWRFQSLRGQLGGLCVQKIAEEFLFARLGVGGCLNANVRNDRRNFATVRDVLQGMRRGESGFHDFDSRGGKIIFGPKSDYRSTSMKNVANQLECSGAHHAVGVDSQRDVKYVVAAQQRFGNHKAFVFAPLEPGGNMRGGCIRRRVCGVWRLQEMLNQGAQRIGRRRLVIFLIGREHALKGIDGGENNFREPSAVGLANLKRQNVFQLVSNFAELLKTARSRIALQCMDGAAHTANQIFIRGTLLQLQARVVDDLKDFRGTLKEERAEFVVAVLGQKGHALTSSRLYAVPLFSWTMRNFCVRPNKLSAWPTNRY